MTGFSSAALYSSSTLHHHHVELPQCNVLTWEWHIMQDCLFFSPEWKRFLSNAAFPLRLDLEEWHGLVHEEDLPLIKKAALQIRYGTSSRIDVAFRIRKYDGCWAWLLCQGDVTAREGDKAARVTGVSMDVSRLRSDPVFQQSGGGVGDPTYHAMLENSPDMVVRMDRELFPLYINPVVSRYLDRSQDEFPGNESLEALHIEPQQLAFLQRNVNRVFEEKVTLREMVTFKTAYGYSVTGEYSFWPEFGPDGKVKSVMTQFRDLTEQIRVEKQARLNEMRLEALYQLTQMETASEEDVIFFVLTSIRRLTNSMGSFFFIPENLAIGKGKLFWSCEGTMGANPECLLDAILPADIFFKNMSPDTNPGYRSILNGDGVSPLYLIWKEHPVMRCIVAPCIENDQVVCLAGARNKHKEYDESDLQQIETFIRGAWLILRRLHHMREMQRAKEASEAANQAKADFLANVNHELRTPLTSILGYAETMLSLRPEDEGLRMRCIAVIQRHAEQMHKLVEELLSLSRLESSCLPLDMGDVCLAELARKGAEALQAQTIAKRLRVCIDISPAVQVRGDKHFLGQVFRNLVENACRYAPSESDIVIAAEPLGQEMLVSVSDTGPGIEPDDLERIFERFYCSKPVGEGYKSTGIGLSICKHVVERHGGTIWAENANPGAIIRFTLPLAG